MIRRALWAALALYLALLTAGIVTVALRHPTLEARPGLPTRAGVGPLTRPGGGAWVSASSAHSRGLHQPIFAIDGVQRPSQTEKWASDPSDPAPWLQINLLAPARLRRVTLTHAGAFERPDLTMDYYDLICLRQGQEQRRVPIRGNTDHVAHHDLDCPDADALRVRFYPWPRGPRQVARLYELTLHGDAP